MRPQRRFDLPLPQRRGPHASRGTRGMTLAEVLVAMSILALIGVLTYGTFSRSLAARDTAERITTHYHEIRQAMLRMSREISMAFLSKHKDCEEPRSSTIFASKRASGGMRLDFTSFSHVKTMADANESDQNELSYFIGHDPDEPGKQALFRREQARIDSEPTEGGVEEPLVSDVTSLRFEFYDPKEDRWDEEWDSTNMDYRDRVPMFVKIELKVKDLMGKEETFVTKTRVFLQKPLSLKGVGFVECVD